MANTTVQIIIIGLVQGVSFRYYAKKLAVSLGLTGFAKNLGDGSINVLVQGNKDNIDEFIGGCKKGPEQAKVENIRVKEINSKEKFNNFEIRY
ncbi:acylphosphatase [Candidatus Woesearchaeota archaeon]|nr:acylphosphatase [Candidatus Woesearchaeota archaeon]